MAGKALCIMLLLGTFKKYFKNEKLLITLLYARGRGGNRRGRIEFPKLLLTDVYHRGNRIRM